MELRKKEFAKPLNLQVRFMTALRITANRFYTDYPVISVFMALLNEPLENEDYGFSHNINQYLTKDRYHEARCYFLEIYNDEDMIVSYLNKEITLKYFRRKPKKNMEKDMINRSVRNIINSNISLLNIEL